MDQLAKQHKALEAALLAERNAATERDFIKRDLAEESERVRNLTKARAADKREGDLLKTPKKKSLPHRDGFDDLEVLSPSKLSPVKFRKPNASSPSKLGGKRKRRTNDSPVQALDVIHDDEEMTTHDVQDVASALDDTSSRASRHDGGLDVGFRFSISGHWLISLVHWDDARSSA